MARSFAVFGMGFAGVFLLAGAGWALLAGAVLVVVLWRREPDWGMVRARVVKAARVSVAAVRAAPRRVMAIGGMTGGLLLVPAGLILSAGIGAGVATGGALLIGTGLLTGWNA